MGRGWIAKEIYFGVVGVVVVAIFLANAGDGAFDSSVWVIVGDLPPALFSTLQSDTAAKALLVYVAVMRDWVSAVEQGTTPPQTPRVEAPADPAHAAMLVSRLDMLEEQIYPHIRDYWS